MNFNMVRNWVGQIGEDAFYEAADRNGIVIMQDFWLANPWDGPDPDDNALFMRNANDTLRRIRTHPSIGLYCGRNEGYPLKPLDDSIRASLKSLHPDIQYIGSSADDVISGHGPYQAQELLNYFTQRATPKLHSEMGMPNIMTMDSLRQTMKPGEMWPQGRLWGSTISASPAPRAVSLSSIASTAATAGRRASRSGSDSPSSSITKAIALCSRPRARIAWACSCG